MTYVSGNASNPWSLLNGGGGDQLRGGSLMGRGGKGGFSPEARILQKLFVGPDSYLARQAQGGAQAGGCSSCQGFGQNNAGQGMNLDPRMVIGLLIAILQHLQQSGALGGGHGRQQRCGMPNRGFGQRRPMGPGAWNANRGSNAGQTADRYQGNSGVRRGSAVGLAPQGMSQEQQLKFYQDMVKNTGGRVDPNKPNVVALRGLSPDGTVHGTRARKTMDDTMVVFGRDQSGSAYVRHFRGSSYPGQNRSSQSPDINGDGRGDVATLNEGHYIATPRQYKGRAAWHVKTQGGSGSVGAMRDVNGDGVGDTASKATGILFHSGRGSRVSSIGCQNAADWNGFVNSVSNVGGRRSGGFNYSVIDAQRARAAAPDTSNFAPSASGPSVGGSNGISQESVSMIRQMEGYDQPGKWPGYMSGVTIGVGYDLGTVSHAKFQRDWGDKLDANTMRRLHGVIGKQGQSARQASYGLRDIRIRKSDADKVFNDVTLPQFTKLTRDTYPGYDRLSPNAKGALVSLTFNRGTQMWGKTAKSKARRAEMRAVRSAIARGDVNEASRQISQMKRIWRGQGVDGLLRRRDAEARLIRT